MSYIIHQGEDPHRDFESAECMAVFRYYVRHDYTVNTVFFGYDMLRMTYKTQIRRREQPTRYYVQIYVGPDPIGERYPVDKDMQPHPPQIVPYSSDPKDFRVKAIYHYTSTEHLYLPDTVFETESEMHSRILEIKMERPNIKLFRRDWFDPKTKEPLVVVVDDLGRMSSKL